MRLLKLQIDKYEVMHMGKTNLSLNMKRWALSSHHHPGVKSWGYDSYFHANMNSALGISLKAIQIFTDMRKGAVAKIENVIIVIQYKSVSDLWQRSVKHGSVLGGQGRACCSLSLPDWDKRLWSGPWSHNEDKYHKFVSPTEGRTVLLVRILQAPMCPRGDLRSSWNGNLWRISAIVETPASSAPFWAKIDWMGKYWNT